MPGRLARVGSAQRLVDALEAVLERHGMRVHAFVVLPDALHLVGHAGTPGPDGWPAALGRVKSSFARREHALTGESGPLWREAARVRPLSGAAVAHAAALCHDAPVRAGLADSPAGWPYSSWRLLYLERDSRFVSPLAMGARPRRQGA